MIFAYLQCGNPRVPPMDFLRISYGVLMVLLGFPTVFIGFSMFFSLICNVAILGYPLWISYGFHMIFL